MFDFLLIYRITKGFLHKAQGFSCIYLIFQFEQYCNALNCKCHKITLVYNTFQTHSVHNIKERGKYLLSWMQYTDLHNYQFSVLKANIRF